MNDPIEETEYWRTISALTSVPNPRRAVEGETCSACGLPFFLNEPVWGYSNAIGHRDHVGAIEECLKRARLAGPETFQRVVLRFVRQHLTYDKDELDRNLIADALDEAFGDHAATA